MNFIKEVILTLSLKDKEEFQRFLSRKQPKKGRKDVIVFDNLYFKYVENRTDDILKGDQNYHAIRKRLSKELINFLILKRSSAELDNIEGKFLMIQYFIDLARYNVAWELLIKEEKKIETKSVEIQLKLQHLKLAILPYFNTDSFEETKKKITELQKIQIRQLQFQLSFIQIQKELKEKMIKGDVDVSKDVVESIFNQYTAIDKDKIEPTVYLKIIEIIRGEYLVQRKYKSFATVAQEYYDKLISKYSYEKIDLSVLAQVEYIMAHAYFRTRNFTASSMHIEKLFALIKKDSNIESKYMSRYLSLKSSIDVFKNKLNQAIKVHEDYLESFKARLSLKEQLNLSLNLVAYYCVDKSYKQANRILLFMNQSDSFYQRHMGREWLIRKDLIRTLIQVELNNEEIAISILNNLKKKHSDMFKTEQYAMVLFYINTLLSFLNDPYQTTKEDLIKMEEQTNFQKEKLFDDPKLLSFYVWLKAKITKQELYDLLKKEYELLP